MSALALVVLAASFLLLAGMIAVLVLLRRGEGPRYSASRQYDANRREAVRILTGARVDAVTPDQWYLPDFDSRAQAAGDDDLIREFDEAVRCALREVVPAERDDTVIHPAISTRYLRAELESLDDRGGLVIGIVLLNPEPPGGDARRVTLPVQVLFPALRAKGREDLVRRIEEIRERL